jgi:hypothetical protein
MFLMSKAIIFLFVVLALGYVTLLNGFKTNDSSSYINREFRTLMMKSKMARNIFFLNKPGDGRFDYLANKNNKVLVEVDYQINRSPGEEVEEWLIDIIHEVLRKEAEVLVSEESAIGGRDGFSDKELKEVETESRDSAADEGETYLHIVYISASEETPTNTGLVLSEDSIFIFKDAIDGLSQRETIRDRIEESTLRHEFGHLLGLEHVERDNCVMSEIVEVHSRRRRQYDNIPIDYCEESWEKLAGLIKE